MIVRVITVVPAQVQSQAARVRKKMMRIMATQATHMMRSSITRISTLSRDMWQLPCLYSTMSRHSSIRNLHITIKNLLSRRSLKRQQLLSSSRNSSRRSLLRDVTEGMISMKTAVRPLPLQLTHPLTPRLKTLSLLTLVQQQPLQQPQLPLLLQTGIITKFMTMRWTTKISMITMEMMTTTTTTKISMMMMTTTMTSTIKRIRTLRCLELQLGKRCKLV